MDQEDLMMTSTITALVLSPLWRLELPNNTLLIGFDIDVSGVPVSCIVEDDNIKRYMAYNNIGEGSMVQLTARPLVPFALCHLLQNQRPTVVVFDLQLVNPSNTNMTRDNEGSRKRRYEEMMTPEEQSSTRQYRRMPYRMRANAGRPSKRRRVGEMMEIDDEPANVSNNIVFNADTYDYFYIFFGRLVDLRLCCPDIQNEVSDLDLYLKYLKELYHGMALSSRNFVQHTAAFQKRLKVLSQNRMNAPFDRDLALFPPMSSWPAIAI